MPVLHYSLIGLLRREKRPKYPNLLFLVVFFSFVAVVAIDCVRWVLRWLWDNVEILAFIHGVIVLATITDPVSTIREDAQRVFLIVLRRKPLRRRKANLR